MQVSPSNPTYTLQFAILDPKVQAETPFVASSGDDLIITNADLSPPGLNIPPLILKLIEDIGRDYVFSLGQEFRKNAHAQLSLSIAKGLVFDSCSDERIKKIYEENTAEVSLALDLKQVQAIIGKNITIKTKQVSQEEEKQAAQQLQTSNIIFADVCSGLLTQLEIKDEIKINLEIKGRLLIDRGGGTTTGVLRFPHLLKDISNHYDHKKFSDQTHICIVGPGMLLEGESPMFPQFVELYSLFPNGHFSLLDNNQTALTFMKDQLLNKAVTPYDPFMLRSYTLKIEKNKFYASESYQMLFQEMKTNLALNAVEENASEMLDGVGEIKHLNLIINPKKIKIYDFDIDQSEFKKEANKAFDIVIATMSITLVIEDQLNKNPCFNCFPLLGKFLMTLKETGSLYLDINLMNRLLKSYGKELITAGMNYLQMLLENEIIKEEIPLSDFLTAVQGNTGVINSSLIGQTTELITSDISTSGIIVITRTNKPFQKTDEEKKEIKLKLLQLFIGLKSKQK